MIYSKRFMKIKGDDKMFGFCMYLLALIIGFSASLYGLVESKNIKCRSYMIIFSCFFVFYTIMITHAIFHIISLI